MQIAKYYFLLSGRLNSDLRVYKKFIESIDGYINPPTIINNLDKISPGSLVLTFGYLGLSRDLIINHNKNIDILVLDNPMINIDFNNSFRVQDKSLNILEIPPSIREPFLIENKFRKCDIYLKNIKSFEFEFDNTTALNIDISFPHGDLIKKISNKVVIDFQKEVEKILNEKGLNLINNKKKNAILKLDKFNLPSKFFKENKNQIDFSKVPKFVFSFQSAYIFNFQLMGCETYTSKYNPFNSDRVLHKLELDERISALNEIYSLRTFTGKELSDLIYLRTNIR